MRYLYRALLSIIAFTLLVSPVIGDFGDRFDTYAPGAVNPGPWTFVASDPCIGGSVLFDSAGAQTSPNVYQMVSTSCGSPQTGNLSLSANVTSHSVTWKLYLKGTGSFSVNIKVCGTSFPQTTTTSWVLKTLTAPCTPGAHDFSATATLTSSAEGVLIDTTYLSGGSAIVSGANLFLIDFGTGQWTNITAFPDSTLIINYTGSTPAFVLSNFTTPDLNVPLTGASLVTVYLSHFYFRSVIPTSTSHQIVWLDDPTKYAVPTFTFQVLDFSQEFGPGTQMTLSIGTTLIASGYLDSNHQLVEGLKPGAYQIRLVNGPSVFDTSQSISQNQLGVQVTVPSIKVTFQQVAQSAISCLGFWNSTNTGITGFFRDATTTTTSVSITLWLRNNTGTFTVNTDTFSPGPFGNVTDLTLGTNPDTNQSQNYYVVCAVTDSFGTFNFPSSIGQPVLGGRASSINPTFPDVLHIGSFLPELPNAVGSFGGLGSVYVIAAAFSELFSPIGAVVVGFYISYLSSAGWLPIAATMGSVFTFFAIIGLMIWSERRSR